MTAEQSQRWEVIQDYRHLDTRIAEERKKLPAKSYNEKVISLNNRINEYEKRREAFEKKADDFNKKQEPVK